MHAAANITCLRLRRAGSVTRLTPGARSAGDVRYSPTVRVKATLQPELFGARNSARQREG